VIAIDASTPVKFLLKEEGWDEVIEYMRSEAVSVDLVAK